MIKFIPLSIRSDNGSNIMHTQTHLLSTSFMNRRWRRDRPPLPQKKGQWGHEYLRTQVCM